MDIDLMILFNGFIKNYANLGLSIDSKSIDIINKENKYFITLGKLLGFSVISKKNDDGSIEIYWKECESNTICTLLTKVNITREVDLTKDLSVIYELINKVNMNNDNRYVLILLVSSMKRIEFLNSVVKNSLRRGKYEILIIYIVRDVVENIFNFYAYLFKNGEIIKNKVGISSSDNDENLKAILKN